MWSASSHCFAVFSNNWNKIHINFIQLAKIKLSFVFYTSTAFIWYPPEENQIKNMKPVAILSPTDQKHELLHLIKVKIMPQFKEGCQLGKIYFGMIFAIKHQMSHNNKWKYVSSLMDLSLLLCVIGKYFRPSFYGHPVELGKS